ncbi:MAG: DMT family transporter [Bacteroides sp.]|nr:DMT family transporter [Bacteroides sp.]
MTTDSNNSINHTDAISPSATREVSQPNSSTPSHSNSSTKKKNGRLKGNLCMLIAKTFSGINQNALKYLLPNWMNAYTGVVLRLGFGSIFFWILGWVRPQKENKMTNRDRLLLLGAGVVFVFGFMWTFLLGLTYTTPISSSIFICLQAAVVYLITLCLRTDRFSWGRFAGIILGIGGALVIILTQKHSATASNPLLGNLLSLLSTFLFGSYLVTEKIFLKKYSNSTVSKYTFSGGAIAGLIYVLITGTWFAPVLHQGIFSTPFLILAFILIFPTCLSYLLTDFGLKLLPATVVALYSNWILIVSAIISYATGQDQFSWWQPLAMILIILSVWFVERAEAGDRSKRLGKES